MKHKFLSFFIPVIILIVGLVSCTLFSSLTVYSQKQTAQQKQFVIKNVNVIPMTSPNNILYDATVIITNNRIESVNGAIPDHAEIVDGKQR